MTVALDLPADLESEIATAASGAGLSIADYILQRLRPNRAAATLDVLARIHADQRARGAQPPSEEETRTLIDELRDDGGRGAALEHAYGSA